MALKWFQQVIGFKVDGSDAFKGFVDERNFGDGAEIVEIIGVGTRFFEDRGNS